MEIKLLLSMLHVNHPHDEGAGKMESEGRFDASTAANGEAGASSPAPILVAFPMM